MRVKLAGALIAALLVFGMVFGAGQAAAASLPGEPLYGLKLAAEQARMELTTSPQARAELAAELAENRFGEIAQMVASGQEVDRGTAIAAQQQLTFAYTLTLHNSGVDQQLQAQARLAHMVMYQQGVMASAVGASPQQQESVRALMRSMARVGQELQTNQASGAQTDDRQYPELSEPSGQQGAGPQAGQQSGDGLQDGTGPQYDDNFSGQGLGPDFNYGPGSDSEEEMGSFGGDAYGLNPAAPPNPNEGDESPWGWLWKLFKKDSESGSGSSGNGSSGSGSSGSGSSGSGSSGSGSSGSGSSGNGTPGGKP